MSIAKTYFKLGIFVLLGLAAVVAAGFGLGIRSLHTEKVEYHSYFDESVQGLATGAPVEYRGVPIGTVSATEIAPDRRHVDVELALKVEELRRLGLAEPGTALEGPILLAVPPGLRAQLGSQGLTGIKFVNIDFFDPSTYPVQKLPFRPAEHTIPTAPSLVKSIEDRLVGALERLPDILEGTMAALARVDLLLAQVQDQHIPEAAARSLGNLDGAVSDLRTILKHVDQSKIPDKTAKAIEGLDAAVGRMNRLVERLDADGGLLASTKRAADSLGDLGRTANGGVMELERTMRDLGDAARSVRSLADEIEREPDMLLKGKSEPRKER